MNIDELIAAIHTSIHKANNDHSEWTGGWWLQAYGVEGFLVARIADGIMSLKNRPGYLTLETSFAELHEKCKRRQGRPPKILKDQCRIDIALYRKNDSLSHVIEVKRYWSSACIGDINRLCALYNKYGNNDPISGAIFVQLISASRKNNENLESKLIDAFTRVEEKCMASVAKQGLSCVFHRGTDYKKPIVANEGKEIFSSLCVRICNK